MRIVSRRTLREHWERRPDSEQPLKAWFAEAKAADWSAPNEVKAHYASASILGDGRVVFNIGGNKYRLVAWVNYAASLVYIRFVGTHAEYDRIDARTV